MKIPYRKYVLIGLMLLQTSSLAASYYGANFSLPVISSEPDSLRGFQLMLNYDPQIYQWRQFNIYFDGGFSYFSQTRTDHNTAINIYSIAPIVRYTFQQHGPVQPYFELSIGLSYINRTRIENRNLGIHFAFQDRAGIGALIGGSERFTIGAHVLHYSNSHLSSHNSGISIPLVFDIGYRFN